MVKHTKIIGMSLAFAACVLVLALSVNTTPAVKKEIYELTLSLYSAQTNAKNAVASIYLNYRIFDTIFEALMLLVSVMGVIHFSRHEHMDESAQHKKTPTKIGVVALIVPMIIMLGVYLIVNGHNTPGGGFQGGAALSASLICVFLVRPDKTIRFEAYEFCEKLLFIAILTLATVFAALGIYLQYTQYNVAYLIVMNVLIGLKVFCGLTIIFYRFVHCEDM